MSAKTILIVDDDTALTDNLEDILREEGYLPFSAGTFDRALQLAREREPRAALLDLKLPDGSGTSLLAELKRLDPGCICTLMTAYADLDSALVALHEGAYHYLQKPVRPAELLMLLERVFETISLRDEKRDAENMLRESEERYRNLVEQSPIPVFVHSEERFVLLNSEAVRTLGGTSSADFLGKPVWSIVHPDFRTVVERRIRRIYEKEEQAELMEQKYVRLDGGIIDVEVAGAHVDYLGKPASQVVFRDITGRKLVENELRETNMRLQTLIHAIPDVVYFKDDRGRNLVVNKAFEELVGLSKEEIVGKTDEHLLPPDLAEYCRKSDEKVVKNGKALRFEEQTKDRDGNTIFFDTIKCPLYNETRELLGLLGVSRDITDIKKSEEAVRKSENFLNTIVENIPNMIFVKDAKELKFVRFNKAGEDLLGYSREELVGKSDHQLFPGEEAEFFARKDREALRAGSLVDIPEESIQTRYMGKRILHTKKLPILDESGLPEYLLGISEDITERRRLEAQLLQAQKMEAIGTLAGGVAHDFNNLLQVIQGYADLLLVGRDEEAGDVKGLREILRAAKRGGELTRQLLTFSRKVESKLRPVDLNQEVENARRLLVRTIPRMIDIELRLKASLKPVNADPAQIEQVLLNLAVNARDAMPEGGEIVISTDEITLDDAFCRALPEIKPGEYVMLSVADTGGGIEQAMLERVFEPFYTTKEVGRGTGLGLAMVYGIVKNHGGHVVCRSQASEGTTFKIYLPALEYAEISVEVEAAEEFPRGAESILLVDDEASVSDVGKQMLEKFGYTVITVSDGESALELYRKEQDRIALVILDLIMPGMGGKRCLAELLKRDPNIKVIIASGYSENGPVQESLEAGARGFVGKPYNIGQMLRIIRQVLDER